MQEWALALCVDVRKRTFPYSPLASLLFFLEKQGDVREWTHYEYPVKRRQSLFQRR